MKITSFQLTIQQDVDEQGCGDNFYISIDDKGLANISRPYKAIPIEEQLAIEEVITSAIKAHIRLIKQVDNANKELRLEEYRLTSSVAETTSEVAVESAASQPSHGGSDVVDNDREVSTGAEVRDAPFEEAETGAITMDEAKTPEEMLKAMIASGERKEVRDLPM